MTIKVKFRYVKEEQSFLNKLFLSEIILFLLFVFLVGYFYSDFITTISIIGIILLFLFLCFGINTINLIKERNFYKKNGIKCKGKIKDIKVINRKKFDSDKGIEFCIYIYLVVEYVSPYTNQVVEFITDRVNSNPFIYLSSLDVTVYALEDGRAYATDFKKIKKLKDAVIYQDGYEKKY